MVGSFAIALITAVVLSGSCAATSISRPVGNTFELRGNGEDSVRNIKSGMDDLTSRNEVGYNSDEMEEPESSAQPQSTITMTTRAPQQSSTTENQLDSSAEELHSSTTEHPHNVLGRIFSKPQDKPGKIFFAGGVHNYRVGNDEDERKRAVEEYKYHFVRVEQGLPHTTKRGDKFRAP